MELELVVEIPHSHGEAPGSKVVNKSCYLEKPIPCDQPPFIFTLLPVVPLSADIVGLFLQTCTLNNLLYLHSHKHAHSQHLFIYFPRDPKKLATFLSTATFRTHLTP